MRIQIGLRDEALAASRAMKKAGISLNGRMVRADMFSVVGLAEKSSPEIC
jgi:hypothetical protein